MKSYTNPDSSDGHCRSVGWITTRMLIACLFFLMAVPGTAREYNLFDDEVSCMTFMNENLAVEESVQQGPSQSDYNLFSSSTVRSAATELTQVTNGTVFTLNASALTSLRSAAPQTLTLEIPMDHAPSIILELHEVNIFTRNFFISSDVKEDYSGIDRGLHYQGSIVGAEHSIVAVSIFNNEMKAIFVDDSDSYTLGPIENGSQEYVCYKEADLSEEITSQFNFSCSGSDAGGSDYTEEQLNFAARNPGDITELYVEVDNSIYLVHGSDMTATMNRITSLFNQISAIYAAESVATQISQVNVWTTADPYDGSGPGDIRDEYLSEFQGQYGTLNGDLAILMIQQDIGGVAASYGNPNSGLCRVDYDESMCISGQFGTGINTFPVYQYNTYVAAHELGHLFGSRHTHACVWNGNNTAIDGCSGTEGGCALPPIPASGAATVMSYCQAQLAGGFVAAAPFGPQPGNVIRANVAAANCLLSPAPPNDLISGAAALNCGDDITIDISSATDTDGPAAGVCGTSSSSGPHPGVWYSFTGNGQEVTLSTCNAATNFDTEISVFSGTPASLTCVGNNDDDFTCAFSVFRSTFTFCSELGESYYVYLFGFADQVGVAQLTMSCAAIPHTDITVTGCPADIIDGTDLGDCGAVATWTPPTATLTGGCALGTPTVSSSHVPGEFFPVGTTQVTYTFTYPGLEPQFCFFDIIISDTEAPVFNLCPTDITVGSDPGVCGAIVGIAQGYNWSVSDNCGPTAIVTTVGPGIGELFPIGTTLIRIKAYDAVGHETLCTFNVTVTDTEAPSITHCPAGIELAFNLDCDPAPAFPDYHSLPIFSDNCGAVTVTQTPAAGVALNTLTPGPPYASGATIPVSVTATDAAGLSVTCTFNVTLVDGIGPHIACPGDQIVYTEDEGDGFCNISLPDFTGLAEAGVLCGNGLATVTQSPLPGALYTNGDVITVTLTATDASLNTESCDMTVSFLDNTKPVLVACGPNPALKLTPIGGCTATVTVSPPTVSDNCDLTLRRWGVRSDGGPDLTGTNGYTGTFSPCTSTVDWYAEDDNGNVSDLLCTKTVEVREPINQLNQPVAQCKNKNVGLNDNGEAPVCAVDLNDGSYDACTDDVTYLIARSGPDGTPLPGEVASECIIFTCADIGQVLVCLKVTDCSGNENFCTATVTVEDKKFPYIACPGDIRIECDMDNNGDPLAVVGPNPPHLPDYPQANVPVDLAALQAWFAAGYTFGNPSPGQNDVAGITGLPLAYDNCGAVITYTNKYYLVSDVGFTTPLNYQSDLPINDPHECDHHSYNIVRTWRVTDAGGRWRECDQLIEVRDTTDPVIAPNGIADATLECSDAAGIAAALAPVPTATDNCYLSSFVLVSDNSSAPEDVNAGLPCIHQRITRIWVATDACGNTSTLTQIIDLLDTTAPSLTVEVGGIVFSADDAITLDTDAGKCDRNTLFTAVASDNCDDQLTDQYSISFFGLPLLTFDYDLNGTATYSRVLYKGTHPVTVTVTDDCGNETSITIDVTIEDNEAPTMECNNATETYFTSNADVLGGFDLNGNCTAVVPLLTPPFMDNCPQGTGFLQLSIDGGAWSTVTAGSIYASPALGLGVHTVQYQLTDDEGNVSIICSKDFDIVDDENPVLICPLSKNLTVSSDGVIDCVASYTNGWLGGTYGLLSNIVPVLGDNCGYSATYTLTGATIGTGAFTVTYPAFPAAPFATGLDINFNVGNTSVLYTAMDDEGNMVQCSFSVSVEDNVNPTITCPGNITAVNDPGECNYTANVAPVVADNCAVQRVQYVMTGATGASGTILNANLPGVLASFDFAVGTTFVYYTVYDTRGNSATCSFTVVVADTELPVVHCPADYVVGTSGTIYVNGITGATQTQTQILHSGSDCETTVAGLEVTTTDNCCVSSMQYRIMNDATNALVQNWIAVPNSPQPVDGDQTLNLSNQVFDKGTYRVELRSWDCHLNEGVCSFTVTVYDDEEPGFTYCPADQILNVVPNTCNNNAFWTQPTLADVADNCLPACPVTLEGPFVSFDDDADLADIDATINVGPPGAASVFALFPVGDRYVKYKATDEAGNTTFCSFLVRIVDNQLPTIDCPNDFELAFNLDCDTVSLLDYRGMATVSDNCGILSVSQSPAPGTLVSDIPGITPNIGESFTVTLTVTDLSGNMSDCTFDITIDDIIGPTIACPATQILHTGIGNTDCFVALPDYRDNATASVACGNEEPTVIQNPAPGTLVSGTTIVTMVAIDSQNLTSACSFAVIVIDNTPPTGVCAADPAPATSAIGGCTASVTLTAPTVTDNCSSTTLRGVRSDGGADILTTSGSLVTATFSVYQSTVTWYATDAMFNVALICTNTVTVLEPLNEANEPTAVCQPLELGLRNDGTVSICANVYGAFSFDNCSGPLTMEIHIVGETLPAFCIDFDCSDVGVHQVCLIVTDASGNQDLCYSTITIQDRRDPFIKCPADITIACHTDNGGDPDPGVLVPFAAMSPYNSVFFANWSPQFDSGQDAENGITGAPLAMDNCGGTVTYSDDSDQSADITSCQHYTYTITRTWKVEDYYGAIAECDQVITVKDTIAPWFSESVYYLDRFINCDNPNAAAQLSSALSLSPTPNDLCYQTMSMISDVTSSDYSACISYLGQTNIFKQRTRTWRAIDACGNYTDYVQVISWQDFAAPALVCPNGGATIDVVANLGECETLVPLVATATDCQEVIFSYLLKDLNEGTISGPFGGNDATQEFPVGNYCVEFIAQDPCGNTTSCQVFINVSDDQDPTIDCSGLADVTLAATGCVATHTWDRPWALDNCPDATITCVLSGALTGTTSGLSGGSMASLVFPVGTTTVSYHAVDASGNTSSSCSFDVTVQDATGPYEVGPNYCPADQVLYTSGDGILSYNCSAPFNWKTPNVADGCGVVSYTYEIEHDGALIAGPVNTSGGSSQTFSFPTGVSTVTSTATDASGNTYVCTFTVTVYDDEDPVALCQDIIVDLDANGVAHIAANESDLAPYTINAGTYDNCTVYWSVDQADFDCTDLGANVITLTAWDDAGNSFACSSLVVVRDLIDPVIVCTSGNERNTSADGITGDCDYVASGGEFDASATDNTMAICGLTVTNDYNGGSSLDGEAFSATGSPFVITWTATDVAGNTAQCTIIIDISDDETPSFLYCPASVQKDNLTDNCLALHAWTEPTLGDIFDNCGVASLDGPYTDNGTVVTVNQSNGNAFGNFPVGVTTVSYIATDIYGNTETCSFTVTVVDTQGPIFVPLDTEVYNAPFDGALCGAYVSINIPQVYDLCGSVTFSNDYNGLANASDDYPVGVTIVTWTATDAVGNTSTYQVTVNVANMAKPTGLFFDCDFLTDQARFQWNTVPGAVGYRLLIREVGTGIVYSKVFNNPSANTWSIDENFLPVGNYRWRIVAGCLFDGFEGPATLQDYTGRASSWMDMTLNCPLFSGEVQDADVANQSTDKSLNGSVYSVKVFPNPNNGHFTLATDMEDYNVEVYDMTGKMLLKKESMNAVNLDLHVEDAPAGIYFIRLFNEESSLVERFVIE